MISISDDYICKYIELLIAASYHEDQRNPCFKKSLNMHKLVIMINAFSRIITMSSM